MILGYIGMAILVISVAIIAVIEILQYSDSKKRMMPRGKKPGEYDFEAWED